MNIIVSTAKRTLRNLCHINICFIVAIWLFYGCYLLNGVRGIPFSRWEFVFYMISDHYLLTYFVILILSWSILKCLQKEDSLWRVRGKNKWNDVLGKAAGIFFYVLGVLVLCGAVSWILGMGFPSENKFLSGDRIEQFVFFQRSFQNPAQGALAAAVFLAFGMAVLGALLSFVSQYVGNQGMLVVWVILYASAILGLHRPDARIFSFSLDKFLILHHGMTASGGIGVVLVLMASCLAAVLAASEAGREKRKFFLWRKKRSGKSSVAAWYWRQLAAPWRCLAGITVILLCVLSLHGLSESVSFGDLVMELFWGAMPQELSMLDFLRMVILNLFPVFVIAAYLQKNLADGDVMVKIRTGRKKTGFLAMCRAALCFCACYLVGILLLLALLALILGKGFEGITYIEEMPGMAQNPAVICVLAAGLRFLELTAATMLILLFSIWDCTPAGISLYLCTLIFYFADGESFRFLRLLGMSSLAGLPCWGQPMEEAAWYAAGYAVLLAAVLGMGSYQLWKRRK